MSIDKPTEEDLAALRAPTFAKPTIIRINVKPRAKPTRSSEIGKNVTVVKLNGTPPDSCGEDEADDVGPSGPKRRIMDGGRKTPVTPSCQAVKHAVSDLYRIDDFHMEKIGVGFFSDVYKATHKTSKKVMVLKQNKHKTNRNNMLKEVQLMNRLKHPNILRLEAACVNNGQLHALTEYIDGGDLEQLIQKKEMELPWSLKLSLALDIAKGLAYLHSRGMFHRDLTSKNILIRSGAIFSAVIGDFGLATNIPEEESGDGVKRLPQVGSPYWMSPECLKGEYYDQRSDIFSFGIVLCELIARTSADPDVLPRTENFGVDYIAFSKLCLDCPPEFLKVAFSCVRIDPKSRPSAMELSKELGGLLVAHKQTGDGAKKSKDVNSGQKQNGDHKKMDIVPCSAKNQSSCKLYYSPSEKARFHFNTPLSIGKEMSIGDPHYRPTEDNKNPFLALSIREGGMKILADSPNDKTILFSSCFERPSLEMSNMKYTWSNSEGKNKNSSLPSSPQMSRKWKGNSKKEDIPISLSEDVNLSSQAKSRSLISHYFDDQMFQGRVQLLRKLYSGGYLVTKDDSALDLYSSTTSSSSYSSSSTYGWSNNSSGAEYFRSAMVRRGSCESGFYSSYAGTAGRSSVLTANDDSWRLSEYAGRGFEYEDSLMSFSNSAKSVGSSLLTVSDLEEDLRAASLFLSSKRTSSVFTDSMDDLSSITDQDFDLERPLSSSGKPSSGSKASAAGGLGSSFLNAGAKRKGRNCYEKDIRNIVEYFETSCNVSTSKQKLAVPLNKPSWSYHAAASSVSLQRSQKIENLIKRVVEKESRERFRKAFLTTGTSIPPSTGIGVSKVFQQQQRLQVCDGIVRSKLPIFDASKHNVLQRSRLGDHQKPGHVKARKAFFDQGAKAHSQQNSESAKMLAEKRLQALAHASSSMNNHKKDI